jgi:hypothetical protein
MGLGRWTWMSYQGKGLVSLKAVAAYRPCKSDGALSTYSQHVNYLYEQDDDRCPMSHLAPFLIVIVL